MDAFLDGGPRTGASLLKGGVAPLADPARLQQLVASLTYDSTSDSESCDEQVRLLVGWKGAPVAEKGL